MLNITHVLQLSRLFRRQWWKSSSGNRIFDHKCLQASIGFDCAKCRCRSDHCGRNVFALHDKCEHRHMCFICYHEHICAWQELVIHKSLFCRGQTLNFVECDPGPYKTMKYKIWVLFVVRKCASSDCINDFSAVHYKTHFSHIALQRSRGPDVRLRGEHTISEVSVWLMFGRHNLVIPRGFCVRLL